MRTIIRNISLLLCVAATLASCERKPLYDDCVCSNTLSIPINIDWEISGVIPQNVSILFYNTDDGALAHEHIYEHNNNDIQSYASLPEGSYTAVVFNELRDQIDYMSCIGYENITTLKFEGNDDDPLRSRVVTRGYIQQSGDLAVAMIEGIEVTTDMILESKSSDSGTKTSEYSVATRATVESLSNVTPKKKNTTIAITAHIKNIYYALMPALVDLVNMSDGYFVYGDRYSDTPATLQFTMNNRTYDEGSYYDGTISTTITTFGTLDDRSSTSGYDESTYVMLDLLFQQIDENQTEVTREVNVTSSIIHTLQSDGSYLIIIDIYVDEELPVVEPAGTEGSSGFGSSVEDWNSVDVPLQQ